MVQRGIIAAVSEPTEWISSPVVVLKPNGKCISIQSLLKSFKEKPLSFTNYLLMIYYLNCLGHKSLLWLTIRMELTCAFR